MHFRPAETIACCVLLLTVLAVAYCTRTNDEELRQLDDLQQQYLQRIDSLEQVIEDLPKPDSTTKRSKRKPKDKNKKGDKAKAAKTPVQPPIPHEPLNDVVGGS